MAVPRQDEMLTSVEKSVKLGEKRGADEVEAFAYHGLTTNVNIERGQISKSSRIIDRGLGIRVILNKSLGFAFTNVLNGETAIQEIVLRAFNSAKASRPDKNWRGLPIEKTLVPTKDTYDKRIAELNSENLVTSASIMLDSAQEMDKRVLPIEGGVGASHLCKAIANSNGIRSFDHGTIIECSLATIAKDKNETTPMCFEFNMDRQFHIDPEGVGREAARLATQALKAKRIETRETNVIFTQFALQQLLNFTLINAVKADYVQRNKSAFKGKIGKKVASSSVTIHDNGLLNRGIRTWKFDDEGVPQQKTMIIEKGILKNFIYDSYTAKKEGKESTGNASRAGYTSTPHVTATNFQIAPGNISSEEMIDEVEEGLLVYFLQGAHSSNPASGEFSVVATPAWQIRRGEVGHAAKGAMLAGNIFQIMTNISLLANNERQIGQLVAPWISVKNVKVVGK
ncbi:MAG: TldD/PmbA family protein [Candidatus Bathyarchaeota archaeon]